VFAEKVIPTKSELMRLRRRLGTARRVHKILEDKKEYELDRIRRLIEEAIRAREEMDESLSKAYRSLAIATMRMGRARVEAAIFTATPLAIASHLVAQHGIQAFKFEADVGHLTYSFGDTSTTLDEAVLQINEAVTKVLRVAEIESQLFLLSRGLKKLIRLVNMLEHVVIPSYVSAVSSVESSLEEKDREEFVRLKIIEEELKQRHARRPR